MSAANVAAPKASMSYLKAALLSTAAVLVVIGVARRVPVVGPMAQKAVDFALK